MSRIIKKYGIPVIVIAAIVFGVGSYISRAGALKELTFKDGLHEQALIENAAVVEDKEREIKKLQGYIAVVEEEKLTLIRKVNTSTASIRMVRTTRTELAEVRLTLTDKDDIIYNQDLQIQEFIKSDALQENRFLDLRKALQAQKVQTDAAIAMAKDYHDLWQKEEALHKLSVDAYADYKSKVVSRQFKVTIKGIGEKLIYAAAGYGLGKVTG